MVSYLIPINIYSNFISKIILSIVIVYISFTPKSWKEMTKNIVFFYLVSFIFGGGTLAVIYMVNSGKISIQNGMIVGNYTLITILMGILIAFCIIFISFKFIKIKLSKSDLICNIRIKIYEQQVETRAMLDTGNFLKEPITNIPVVVIEHTLLKGIIPDDILNNIENVLGGDLRNISENTKIKYMSRLKVIPFSSLGKQNGMLLGIKADGIEIEQTDGVKKVDKVIVGLYNKKINRKQEYKALLGIDIF